MLEEFRLMTNANYDRQSPLTLILLGQPPLRLRLKSSKFEALSQRLRYRFRLEGLNQDETTRYIQLRLLSAGMTPELFSQDALHQIFQLCEGLPRRINNLCALALLMAKAKKRSIIDAAFLNEVTELE
jgi:type II secretory pathway predicted ATPase ExeA